MVGESDGIGRADWGSSWRLSASRIGSYAAEDVLVGDEAWRCGRSGGTEELLASDAEESDGLLADEGPRLRRLSVEEGLGRRRGRSSHRAAMEMRLAAIGSGVSGIPGELLSGIALAIFIPK